MLRLTQARRFGSSIAMLGIAFLPFLMCCLAGTVPRESPALSRTEPPRRTLQFHAYCLHHGMFPVEPAAELVSYFHYRNIGSTPITIGDVDRSCGCLQPEFNRRTVEPGETGIMKVSVAMAEQGAGFQEYRLLVNYDDSRQKEETLLIKAVLPEPEILVTPRTMIVSQRTSTPLIHNFTLTDGRTHPLTVKSVSSSVPWVSARVAEPTEPLADRSVTKVAVEISGDLPPGTHRVLVSAETDDLEFPVITMPLLISGPRRQESVEARPSMIRMVSHERVTHKVSVNVPSNWDVSHVECYPDELQASWQETDQSNMPRHKSIDVELGLGGKPAKGVREGVVTIHANGSEEIATFRVEIIEPAAGGPAEQSAQQ
jgi:hypothetical protein